MGRHRGHGMLKAIKQVAQPERHRTASRPNPWPRCDSCMHRVPSLCPECLTCGGCCPGDHDEEKT